MAAFLIFIDFFKSASYLQDKYIILIDPFTDK